MAPRQHVRAAFFDVDETLISVKSMFRFLRHHLAATGRPPSAYTELLDHFRSLAAAGASRAELVRVYYRLYAGQPVAELAAQGREWFRHEQRGGRLFLPAPLRAFRGHHRAGDLTVLVSGSFAPCLDPIAQWLGAARVLRARPESVDGYYTGELATAMIGHDKATAARGVMRDHRIPWSRCYAYGDHASDLPLLRAVGHPVVVGRDPHLSEHAAAHGWPRLPGVEDGDANPPDGRPAACHHRSASDHDAAGPLPLPRTRHTLPSDPQQGAVGMTEPHPYAAEASDPHLLAPGDGARLLSGAPWKRLVVIGDSGAEGVTEEVSGYRHLTWGERFGAELAQVVPGLVSLNLGRRNLCAAEVRASQLAPALEFGPDLAVVFCGGNDLLQRTFDIDATEAEVTHIVRALRDAGCTVVTSGLFDITVSPYVAERYRTPMSERIAAWSERTRRLAARLGAVHLDLPRHPAGTEEIFSTDGLHLNARGQAILSAEIVRALAAHLRER